MHHYKKNWNRIRHVFLPIKAANVAFFCQNPPVIKPQVAIHKLFFFALAHSPQLRHIPSNIWCNSVGHVGCATSAESVASELLFLADVSGCSVDNSKLETCIYVNSGALSVAQVSQALLGNDVRTKPDYQRKDNLQSCVCIEEECTVC